MNESIDHARLEAFASATHQVGERLKAPAFDPDPKRSDWPAQAASALELHEIVQPFLRDAARLLQLLEHGPERNAAAEVVYGALEELASLLTRSERRDLAGRVLHACQEVAEMVAADGGPADEIPWWRACVAVPELHAELVSARWLIGFGRDSEGERILKKLLKGDAPKALKDHAQALLNRPKPIRSAPSLSTINGVGFGLYGHREDDDYGTYVTTHCFCVLFIPLIPIAAYRVSSEGGGRYQFYAKVPLSRFARLFRLTTLSAATLAIVGACLAGVLNDPHRLANGEIAAAVELESEDPAQALSEYQRIFNAHLTDAPRVPPLAAAGVVRLAAARVPSPVSVETLPQAKEAIDTFAALTPASARGTAASEALSAAVAGWVDQLGGSDVAHANAQLELLDHADRSGLGVHSALTERRMLATLVTAQARADAWPALALADHAAYFPSQPALVGATELVRRIVEVPSLASEQRANLLAWAGAARGGPHADLVTQVSEVLQSTMEAEADDARQLALASEERAQVEAALRDRPDDHELVAALAAQMRAEGETEAALARLEALGAPGLMRSEALMERVRLLVDLERLEEADAMLGAWVEGSLPRYRATSQAYANAADAFYSSRIDQAQQGTLPAATQARINQAPTDEDARTIFGEWVREEMQRDPNLVRLRDDAFAYRDVVSASITLGMVRLRLANAASGEPRQAYFAGAERAFVAVRQEAEGLPSYHIGLGQVFHRLGRATEGEQEFATVLATQNPQVNLEVALAYRELGLEERARQVATGVYDASSGDLKGYAAHTLSLLARSTDERERWLRLSPQGDEAVQLSLAEVEAERALERGEYGAAADALERAARGWARGAESNSSRSNNAAVAWMQRYSATGETRDLERAVDMLEQALRQEPDSAITALNLASSARSLANARLAARYVRLPQLRFTTSELSELVEALLEGERAEEARTRLASDPALRRSLDVLRQLQVLAPQRASAFSDELDWYTTLGDQETVARLETRILQMQWDAEGPTRERDDAESGARDEVVLRRFNSDIARAEARLQAAQGRLDEASVASAAFVLAQHELRRHWFTRTAEDLDHMIEHLEFAGAWDGLKVGGARGYGLLTRAAVSVAATDEALASALTAHRRQYDTLTMLHRHQAAGGDLGALRQHPDFVAAVAAYGAPEEPWTPTDAFWHVVSDRAGAAPDVRGDARALRHARAIARLNPAQRRALYVLEWMEGAEGS